MSIKTDQELNGMTRVSEIVGETLRRMRDYAQPGMTTQTLDKYGEAILQSYGAQPAPRKDYGFPGCTCISVNQEAAHGIPSDRVVLREGDLVNIDVSAALNGYYGDNGGSFVLGRDLYRRQPLVEASREILYRAIRHIRGGVKISAVGGLIEREARQRGFTTIKNLLGHGIGLRLHEAPREIPCYDDPMNRERFRKDSVIALETFISTGARYVYEAADGWTMKARDGSLVAQHEHTLLVTDRQPMILTRNNGI